MIDLSIIIVTYNSEKFIENCVRSIIEKTKDLTYDIHIIDNSSRDKTIEVVNSMMAQYQHIHLIQSENNGFNAANNLGIKNSDSRYIALLNPDTILLNNAFKIIIDGMEIDRKIGAAGASLYTAEGEHNISAGRFPSLFYSTRVGNLTKTVYYWLTSLKKDKKRVDFPIGADFVFRREMIDVIGYLDEQYFLYFDEVDYAFTMHKKKFKNYLFPKAKIIHFKGMSTEKVSDFARKQYFESCNKYLIKNLNKTEAVIMISLNIMKLKVKKGIVKLRKEHQKTRFDFYVEEIARYEQILKSLKQSVGKKPHKNFITLFPGTENFHLAKGVGMIPYIMYKHFGYQSKIASYKNGEYPYLEKEVKGLKIDFIKKYTKNWIIDGLIYLIKNGKKIDVLQLLHFARRSLIWMTGYKLVNKKGKIHLKLDADYGITNIKLNPKKGFFSVQNVKFKFYMRLLKQCNLISVETTEIYEFLRKEWTVPVEYMPIGFYDYGNKKKIDYQHKKNIICTVGRIGTEQKATDTLLEGFKIASEYIKDWTLKIIGPVEKEFEGYIHEFFSKNPELKEKIIFTGGIYDREQLEKEYAQAKIFCLPSRWESFGTVFVEAMKNGCFIICSNVLTSNDVTDNKKYGDIFSIDDTQQLAECIINICNDELKLEKVCDEIQDFAYKKFYWVDICKKIDTLI